MGFFKKNSYQIVRLFINQIGIAIFGLVLSFVVLTAFREKDDSVPLLLVSIFSVLFYLFLIYSVGWEIGGKERIHLDAVKEPVRGGKGFFLMLFAQVPNLLFCAFLVAGGIIAASGNLKLGSTFFCIGYFPMYFLDSMYTGILKMLIAAIGLSEETDAFYYFAASLCYLATTLPAILVSGFSYWMGVHEKRIIPAKTHVPPTDET